MSPSRNICLASRQLRTVVIFYVTSLLIGIQESLQIAEFTLHIVHNLFQDGDSRFVMRQSKGGICIDICICIYLEIPIVSKTEDSPFEFVIVVWLWKKTARPNQSGDISFSTFSCKNFQMYKTVFLKHKGTTEIPKDN